MLAACFASNAGRWNVGRTATINSIRSVTAASAAAVDHASSEGASTALDVVEIELRDERQIEANLLAPLRELLHIRPTYFHVSFSTLRSHPPNTGSQ